VLDHLGTWSDMLPFVELTYNNNMVEDAGLPYVGNRMGN